MMNISMCVKKVVSLTAFLALSVSIHLEGCTGIRLTAKDATTVHGRTLEFGVPLDISVAFFPRGYSFVGTTPGKAPGMNYRSKYAAIGATAFDSPAILDGMNEKGLAAAVFYFTGFAGYSELTLQNQSKALSPNEFVNWIITQFATVDEVEAALNNVAIVPTVSPKWGPTPPPFHYIVYDKMGGCLVIEPINGRLVTHDNKLGIFTNSPTFDWHMINLRNYINLTPVNVSPIEIDGVRLTPLGQGSGMLGLPGDFTPPSRFVRAAIFSLNAVPSETSNEAVFQVFHILNQFDIPVGSVAQKEGGVKYLESTSVTTVRDPQTLQMYFKTYEDQTIRKVDLNSFDFNSRTMKSFPISDAPQKAIDVSSSLK